jgi:hypothetical protein
VAASLQAGDRLFERTNAAIELGMRELDHGLRVRRRALDGFFDASEPAIHLLVEREKGFGKSVVPVVHAFDIRVEVPPRLDMSLGILLTQVGHERLGMLPRLDMSLGILLTQVGHERLGMPPRIEMSLGILLTQVGHERLGMLPRLDMSLGILLTQVGHERLGMPPRLDMSLGILLAQIGHERLGMLPRLEMSLGIFLAQKLPRLEMSLSILLAQKLPCLLMGLGILLAQKLPRLLVSLGILLAQNLPRLLMGCGVLLPHLFEQVSEILVHRGKSYLGERHLQRFGVRWQRRVSQNCHPYRCTVNVQPRKRVRPSRCTMLALSERGPSLHTRPATSLLMTRADLA